MAEDQQVHVALQRWAEPAAVLAKHFVEVVRWWGACGKGEGRPFALTACSSSTLPRWKKELQHFSNARSPRLLVMLAPFGLDIAQVVVRHPALRQQRVAQRSCVGDDIGALAGAGVEPDAEGQLRGQTL